MYMLVDNKSHKVVSFVKEETQVFGYDTFACYTVDDTVRFNVYVIDNEQTYLAREELQDDTLSVTDYLEGITYDKLVDVMDNCDGGSFTGLSLVVYYYFTSNAKEYYDKDIPF